MSKLPVGEDPEAALRRALMEEYLSDQGYTFEDLAALGAADRERVFLEAAAYAALRLSERAFLGDRTK